ncbi:MAG: ThiF family adenylyltransferase [Solirubrobacterales bacterium]
MSWSIRIPQHLYEQLRSHLHQADRDEHAAFLFAGLASINDERRLLVRRVEPISAQDFGPSDRGAYRQVASRAIAAAARTCEERGERLLWAHSHPGARSRVAFSEDDLATHRRAHPHLIDMTGGRAVTSLVMGTDAAAGEVWAPNGDVSPVDHVDVVGARIERLTPAPTRGAGSTAARFDRQVQMFGREGQEALRRTTVAVVGAGGGGSLLVQSLAHLGVGRLIVLDFDRVEASNLSRIVGARPRDARVLRPKIAVAERLVRSVDPGIVFDGHPCDITYVDDARRLLEADFIFSASDTQFARFAFNAVCHQYLIPGAQVGAKVMADSRGHLRLAYAMHRPVDLAGACLECGGAIGAEALRKEQLSDDERKGQQYVGLDEVEVIRDPSVITLNAASTAMAMLDFQFSITGQHPPYTRLHQRLYHAPERELREREMLPGDRCRWCGRGEEGGASYGRGDDQPLPLRPGSSAGLVRIPWRQRFQGARLGRREAIENV